MAGQYSTRNFLRQMPNDLLARYFQGRGVFADMDFATMKEGKPDKLFAAWLSLPDSQRNKMDTEFRDIFEMSCEKGFRAIIDEANWQMRETPDRLNTFIEKLSALSNHYERAMATFLDYKGCWKGAMLFYHADTLPYWRKRKNLPQQKAAVDEASLQQLAALPFASVSIAQAPFWAGAAGVIGGLLLAMQLPWSLRLSGLPLMLPVLLWQATRPTEGQFELLAADIGQGNAVLVRTATHALVYDAGPRFSRDSDAGHRVLVPLLRALDVRVDTLMLSHRDTDHVGGALAVMAMQPQAELMSSIEDDHELQAVRPATRCVAGQRWRWDGVDFEVLHPRAADYAAANKSNAMSCTLRISNGVQSALLAGDIEQAQEARLAGKGAGDLKSDVLLVPHHGSKTSSSATFLDAVQPQIALVQAGYRNRFGHPAEPVLVRYEERHIRVVDSPHCGAVTWQSAQPQEVTCQRSQGLRYWHHRVP